MAKEVREQETEVIEAAQVVEVPAHSCSTTCECRKQDNKGLILAIAGGLALLLIGLLLGYLIGHHNDRDYRGGNMMNSGNRRTVDRDRMPMHQQRSSSSTQQGQAQAGTNTTAPQTHAQ